MKSLKGMVDLLPPEISYWHKLENAVRHITDLYSYREIRTPLLEKTELFCRGVGEGTDIVNKEMYTFNDKGDRSITLRPEGTASVARALIQNLNLNQSGLQRLYYIGPMFRYERPQKGRQRQFHQFGFEAVGSKSPYLDIEIISMSMDTISNFGIKNPSLNINTVGCSECKPAYVKVLKEYFSNTPNLCNDCNTRLEKNTLRILDCKIESCSSFNKDIPKREDHMCNCCIDHFSEVINGLKINEIPYVIDDKLVRGLDYYTKTAFEITSPNLGSQNAIGGGGRYDSLISQLGGPDIPAVGYASGMERLIIAYMAENEEIEKESPTVFICPLSVEEANYSFHIAKLLRKNSINTEVNLSFRKMKHQLKECVASGAEFAIILGEDERKTETVALKNLIKRTQETINLNSLVSEINK